MVNQITGKVIAVSDIQTIQSKTPGREPMVKRQLLMDCTRHDPITGVRDQYENTPLLDFGGKALEKLNALVGSGLKKDDIVTVSFVVQGNRYEKDGKQQVFTHVRPYDIVIGLGKEAQQTQQPQAEAAAPAPQSEDKPDDLPFDLRGVVA